MRKRVIIDRENQISETWRQRKVYIPKKSTNINRFLSKIITYFVQWYLKQMDIFILLRWPASKNFLSRLPLALTDPNLPYSATFEINYPWHCKYHLHDQFNAIASKFLYLAELNMTIIKTIILTIHHIYLLIMGKGDELKRAPCYVF